MTLMTLRKAAERCGVLRETIRSWADIDGMAIVRDERGRLCVTEAELERYLAERRQRHADLAERRAERAEKRRLDVIAPARAALARIETDLAALGPDRTPEHELAAFKEGVTIIFETVGGIPPFFASMLNQLIQPHHDHAFTKATGSRDPKDYTERMKKLLPVELVNVLRTMDMTTTQAALAVADALTSAGYRWPESDRKPVAVLLGWHTEASRKAKKINKIEQLRRAKEIVLLDHAAVCQTESQPAAQRTALIDRVAARVAAY